MLPPGPRAPAFLQSVKFLRQPRAHTRRLRARYGAASSFRSLVGDGIAIYEPELAREVFAAPPDTFETVRVLDSLFGPSAVIVTAGAKHRKQRKLLNPRFHGARVKSFLGTMQAVVRAHLSTFARASRTGEVLVMTDVTQAMTLDVILETVFGASHGMDRARARRVLLGMLHGFSPMLVVSRALHHRLFPAYRRLAHGRRVFDAWVDELVHERRARAGDDRGDDVLGVLLDARYDDGSAMPDAEIRDQLLTLLLAGHETSAIAIAWGVHHLLRTPAALERLRAEVHALGAARAPEALVKLPYLGGVVSETLRVEPIVTDVLRVCREPFRLGGRWVLERGQVAGVMLVSILEDPRLFPEPEAFRPERFLDRSFSAWEFLPFGGGARRCLGAAFAEAELSIALAEIFAGWDLELVDRERDVSVRRNITMGPSRGVRVRVHGRRAVPRDAAPRAGRAPSDSVPPGAVL